MIVLKRKDSTVYIMKSEVTHIEYTKSEHKVEVYFKDRSVVTYYFISDIDFR